MAADAFDVFSDAPHAPPPTPAWLLAAAAAARDVPAPTLADDAPCFVALPPEVHTAILAWLPARALAATAAVAAWLNGPVREACLHICERTLPTLPVRRLGEGWPCVVRRAELRYESRRADRLSAGAEAIAWISDAGEAHFEWLPNWMGFVAASFPAPPRQRALAVACGAQHVLCLLDDGSVVCLRDGPTPASGTANGWERLCLPARDAGADDAEPAEHVVSVASGAFHMLLVGSGGALWTCGWNRDGQLGLGFASSVEEHGSETVAAPSRVPLPHRSALHAAGGGYHSLVLGRDGGVLSFGHGGDGRLGLGDSRNRPSPCVVPLPGGSVACAVAAGGDYSLVLTEQGHVLVCGRGDHGILGGASLAPAAAPWRWGVGANALVPTRVPLGDAVVRHVSAGYDHCLALTASGEVLSWGSPAPADEEEADEEEAEARRQMGPGLVWTGLHSKPGPYTVEYMRSTGQLGRSVGVADLSHNACTAVALGRCALVAAGANCSVALGLVDHALPASTTTRAQRPSLRVVMSVAQ